MPLLAPILTPLSSRQRLGITNFDTKFASDQGVRNTRYAFNESFLNNRVYRPEALGGFREQIFKDTFGLDCTPELRLVGAYNPVPAVVGAYQNVFRGTFGQEIKVDDKVNDHPVNAKLIADDSPVGKVWRWSDLDTEKHLMQEWAANLGTVGIRVVAVNADDASDRRVFLQIHHPGAINDFDIDDRGNVTAVELKYTVKGGDIGSRHDVEVREVLDKGRLVKEVGGKTESDEANELGVCPYVILRHRDDGGDFGKWAYAGSEDTIHWINWLIVNQGESIMEHAWPQWFAAAGGPTPEEVPIGRRKIAYVKMLPDTPTPIFEPLVAPLDQVGSLAYWNECIDRLQERQPELATVAMKVLSGQSGETIAKLQIPAESAILRARALYEHAVIRALQIALSEGVRLSLWDLGTGMGSTEAADAAYQDGFEDFAFTERPALPATAYDKVQQANANVAEDKAKFDLAAAGQRAGLDEQAALEKTGLKAREAAKIVKRKRRVDVVPNASANAF